MTTAGSLALEGVRPPADAFIVDAAARRRRRHPREDEPERVGELPIDALLERLERARRADAEPVRARSQSLRLELGIGGRRGGEPGGRGDRHRNRRVDRVAGADQCARRHQADGRPSSAARASCRSPTARTPPARWRERSPTPPRCSARWRAGSGRRGRRRAQNGAPRLLDGFSTRTACEARASGSSATVCSATASKPIAWPKRRSPMMKARGAVIVDPANIPTLGSFDDARVRSAPLRVQGGPEQVPGLARAGLAGALAEGPHRVQRAHRKSEELPYFGQELLAMAEAKGPLTSAEYTAALASNRAGCARRARHRRGDGEVPARRAGRADGRAGVADRSGERRQRARRPGPSGIAAVAGYPHITVPVGYFRGLPVGISFFGRAWSEPTLIKLAYAYEQATKHRRPPTFAPTAQLLTTLNAETRRDRRAM